MDGYIIMIYIYTIALYIADLDRVSFWHMRQANMKAKALDKAADFQQLQATYLLVQIQFLGEFLRCIDIDI